ncbi:TerC family protein [Kribbella pittospori]|uniref:TerC family protein n=1 Tax=Kribbella pittospori TaxID=722689 RepID=UPI003B501454
MLLGGGQAGSEYFAGYITEEALSVDNLFVFLVIMSSFRLPREDQQKMLLFGIVFSLARLVGIVWEKWRDGAPVGVGRRALGTCAV